MQDDLKDIFSSFKGQKEQLEQHTNLQNMKITILGSSGAGKTAYMLGMFAEMQTGIGGFTVTTDHDTENILRNQWDALVIGGEKRWPTGTPTSTLYRFAFNYSYNPIMQFDWLDYRGGAMMESSNDDDVQVLLQHLQESDCIFLCIPGELLEANQTNNKHQVITRAQTAKMNGFLKVVGERLKPTINNPFPIVLIITKADSMNNTTFSMINSMIGRSPFKGISDTVQNKITNFTMKLFPTLFAPNSGWLTMICPVTLGKGLAKDNIGGKIEPVNISLPLIFAIQSKFFKNKLSINDKKTRPLDFDYNTVKIETSSNSVLGDIELYMELLKKHLTECPIFLGGRDK